MCACINLIYIITKIVGIVNTEMGFINKFFEVRAMTEKVITL